MADCDEDWDNDEPGRYNPPPAQQQSYQQNDYSRSFDTSSKSSRKSDGYDRRDDRRGVDRDRRDDRRNVGWDRRDEGRDRRDDDRGRRDRGDDSGGGRNYDLKESMDTRSEDIGRIIGRGGSNVQKLQNDFNVRVDVDRNSGRVTVSGNVQSDIDNALRTVREQLDRPDNGGERRNRGGGGGSGWNGGGGGGERRDNYSSNYGGNKRESNYGGGSSRSYDNNDKYRKQKNEDFYNQTSTENHYTPGDVVIDWDSLNKKAEVERKKRWEKCPPLVKNFYREAPEVANLLPEEIARIRDENNNTSCSRVFKSDEDIEGDIPNPIWKFEQCFADYPDLMAELAKQHFERPSPIQAQGWPILLRGEDMIGIAQTGTGKTLAFLLPAMIHTEYQSIPRSERGGPNVLVLAPTRELAIQIEKEVNKYSFRGMRAVCVYGGGNRKEQIDEVERGVEIIICTPGRLNDLIQANVIDVGTITYLVLDEADRMLDMGFEPQIRKVLLDIRPDRQTVMTSATWPPGVRRLAQSYMNNPIQVCVGSLDLAATHTVKQVVEILDDQDKYYQVRNFLKNMRPDDKCIIFCGKKVRADDLSSDLCLEGFFCQCIHGSRDQSDREQAIADISSGEVRILIATDVASRGLDIEDITHVINFDFPRNIEEYVHRVGRTGRAGRTGTSISYITRSDWGMAKELINILEEADQEVPHGLRDMAERFGAMKERRNAEESKFGRGNRGGGRGRDRY